MPLEHSFGKELVTGIAYLGSKGSNIDTTVSNFNNPVPGVGAIQSRRPMQFYVDSREPDKLLPLGTVRYLDSGTNSSYNALQARAEKRYSSGFTFTGSFNYQKAIGVGYSVNEAAGFGGRIPQDPRNYRAERARFNLDQRFRFVFTNVWEIPFLRNRKDFVGLLFGGWAINGIVQLTSGLPVNVTQNGDSHNTGSDSSPRPHIATCLMSLSWSHTSVAGSVTSPSHRIQLPRGQFSSSERHFRATARRDSCFAIVTASSVASSLSGSKNGHPAGAVDASFDAAASPLWSE